MTIIKTPWGGRSRFVLTLFSDVNKTGTNHEHPKCCKIVTLLHTGHRPSVAKLSHCCRWDTLLQDCHTVADRQWWTIVFTMWHIGKILVCACACRYNVYCVYVHDISFCYVWYHVCIYRIDIVKTYGKHCCQTFLLYAC